MAGDVCRIQIDVLAGLVLNGKRLGASQFSRQFETVPERARQQFCHALQWLVRARAHAKTHPALPITQQRLDGARVRQERLQPSPDGDATLHRWLDALTFRRGALL